VSNKTLLVLAGNFKVGKLMLCRNFVQTQYRFLHGKHLL